MLSYSVVSIKNMFIEKTFLETTDVPVSLWDLSEQLF